jgi:hypothetical protein
MNPRGERDRNDHLERADATVHGQRTARAGEARLLHGAAEPERGPGDHVDHHLHRFAGVAHGLALAAAAREEQVEVAGARGDLLHDRWEPHHQRDGGTDAELPA